MITLKAICLAAAVTDCGIVTEIFQDGKSIGQGIVTFEAVAQKLASESGLPAFTIPKKDFLTVFQSNAIDFDVQIVLPNEPDKPQPQCDASKKFEFVTRWSL